MNDRMNGATMAGAGDDPSFYGRPPVPAPSRMATVVGSMDATYPQYTQPPAAMAPPGMSYNAMQQEVAAMDTIPSGVAGTAAMSALEPMSPAFSNTPNTQMNGDFTEIDLMEYGVDMPNTKQRGENRRIKQNKGLKEGYNAAQIDSSQDMSSCFGSCNDTPFYLIAVSVFVLAAAVLLTFKLRA